MTSSKLQRNFRHDAGRSTQTRKFARLRRLVASGCDADLPHSCSRLRSHLLRHAATTARRRVHGVSDSLTSDQKSCSDQRGVRERGQLRLASTGQPLGCPMSHRSDGCRRIATDVEAGHRVLKDSKDCSQDGFRSLKTCPHPTLDPRRYRILKNCPHLPNCPNLPNSICRTLNADP